MRWTEGYLAASQRPWRRRPRRGRSAWHACGWVSREPGRPRRLHRKDRRGAGTGSPSPRPWTSHLASDGANRRCSDGTAGRRQRSAGGWAARSRSVSEYRRSGGIEPTRPRGGKGAPAGGTGGGKDGQHTEVGSRLHVTTTDSRTGQISLGDGGGHRLASWTSGYATARSEAVCRGAGCGRTRTSGSVGGQGQQRPWSTRPLCGGSRIGWTPPPVRISPKTRVYRGSRSWIRWDAVRRQPSTGSVRLRASGSIRAPYGCGWIPAMVTRRVSRSITKKTRYRLRPPA